MMIADIFVILDTVQYTPRHEENRTRIKTPQGAQWLTVPMRHSNREQLVLETYIDHSQSWQKRMVKTLQMFYGKTPYYQTYISEIINIFEAPYKTMVELDRASWEPALRLLGITCNFVYASELPVSSRGSQLLLDICKSVKADSYLSGAFGREYLALNQFAQEGVKVVFHEYSYPTYSQRFGDFISFLSYLDMLFNVGLERDRVFTGGQMCLVN
jgi:hypothetical protein